MLKHYIISFIVNVFVGMAFNAMNMLAFKFDHLDISVTLLYVGLIMASNMVWSHEIIHYLSHNKFNVKIFVIGILMTAFFVMLARNQVFVNDEQWLRRMIPHHSTALTTSTKLIENNPDMSPKLYRLAKDIIVNQNAEIHFMKTFLQNKKINK